MIYDFFFSLYLLITQEKYKKKIYKASYYNSIIPRLKITGKKKARMQDLVFTIVLV